MSRKLTGTIFDGQCLALFPDDDSDMGLIVHGSGTLTVTIQHGQSRRVHTVTLATSGEYIGIPQPDSITMDGSNNSSGGWCLLRGVRYTWVD